MIFGVLNPEKIGHQ